MNLQDTFLNQARVQKTPVLVYLIGGHQLRGTIKGFDSFVVMLDVGGKLNMLYKHSISTIMPLRALPMFNNDELVRTAPDKNNISQTTDLGKNEDGTTI